MACGVPIYRDWDWEFARQSPRCHPRRARPRPFASFLNDGGRGRAGDGGCGGVVPSERYRYRAGEHDPTSKLRLFLLFLHSLTPSSSPPTGHSQSFRRYFFSSFPADCHSLCLSVCPSRRSPLRSAPYVAMSNYNCVCCVRVCACVLSNSSLGSGRARVRPFHVSGEGGKARQPRAARAGRRRSPMLASHGQRSHTNVAVRNTAGSRFSLLPSSPLTILLKWLLQTLGWKWRI